MYKRKNPSKAVKPKQPVVEEMEDHNQLQEDNWPKFEQGLNRIFANVKRSMTREEYMILNTLSYTICTTSSGGLNHNISDRPNANNDSKEIFFEKIKTYLLNYIKNLLETGSGVANEEALLNFYSKQWGEYKFSCRVLDGICSYINKYRCSLKNPRFKKVYELSLQSWDESLMKEFGQKVTSAMIKLINKERDGEVINYHVITQVVDSYIELKINMASMNGDNETDECFAFDEGLKKPLVSSTKEYYDLESSKFLEENSFVDYMKKCRQRLKEEEARIIRCLNEKLSEPLIKQVQESLIENHIERFKEEFNVLLKEHRVDDLKLLYDLITKVASPQVKTSLAQVLQQYVKLQGLDAIEKQDYEFMNKDPSVFVDTILGVYKMYRELVQSAFSSDPQFLAAFDQACDSFINNNAVTVKSPLKSKKPPELLAKYVDIILKPRRLRGNSEDDFEQVLCDATTIFKFIQDKDVFHTFYWRMLTRRLLQDNSASMDSEASMLSKIKEVSGLGYTSKLEKLFQDINVSKDLMNKFLNRTKREESLKIDFSVKVISTSCCPFAAKNIMFALPQEMERSVTQFTEFYTATHGGRKLTWLYHLCKGDITFTSLRRLYTFNATTFQMAILLQFNSTDTCTFSQLAEATKLDKKDLFQILEILLKTKLLKCDESKKAGELENKETMNDDTVISLNQNYKNKKLRMNICVPLKNEVKEDDEKTHKSLEEERKFELQAAIVRVMKARKSLKHNLLITEVVSQVASRFRPTMPFIKNTIQHLIETDYLKRSDNERDIYEYIS